MTELAIRSASLTEKIAYSDSLTNSNMLPRQFQDKPANVLWAIEYGETLNITPMAAMTGIHVIENKPGASAALIGGLVRRAGHKLRVTGTNQRATAQIVRSDDPDYVFEVTWELKRNERDNPNAEDAGLLGKQVWKNYPAAMLKARAITQVARDACEEVLFGLHYTPEELGAETDADGNPLELRTARRGAIAEDAWRTPAPAVFHTIDPNLGTDAEDAEIVEDFRPAASVEQVNEIVKTLSARGVNSREQARQIIGEIVNREIGSARDLKFVEADIVLARLREQNAAAEAQDGGAEPEAPAAEPKPKLATGAQLTALNTALGKIGIVERDARIAWAVAQVGRQLSSTKDLTRDEASRLIDALHPDAPADPSLVEQIAADMRAADTSDALADLSEQMWQHHEAGRLSDAQVSGLQDVSLEREGQLAAARAV